MTDPVQRIAAGANDEATLAAALSLLCRRRLSPGAPFDDDVGFFEAGLTSMALSAIIVELKELGFSVALIDFFRQQNVRHLAALLQRRLTGEEGMPDTSSGSALPWLDSA